MRRLRVNNPSRDTMLADRALIADNSKTRWLKSDGTYTRRRPRGPEPPVSAQELLLGAAASGVLAATA